MLLWECKQKKGKNRMLQSHNFQIIHVSDRCCNALADGKSCILYFYPDQSIPKVGEMVELAVSCISIKNGFKEFDVKGFSVA